MGKIFFIFDTNLINFYIFFFDVENENIQKHAQNGRRHPFLPKTQKKNKNHRKHKNKFKKKIKL